MVVPLLEVGTSTATTHIQQSNQNISRLIKRAGMYCVRVHKAEQIYNAKRKKHLIGYLMFNRIKLSNTK